MAVSPRWSPGWPALPAFENAVVRSSLARSRWRCPRPSASPAAQTCRPARPPSRTRRAVRTAARPRCQGPIAATAETVQVWPPAGRWRSSPVRYRPPRYRAARLGGGRAGPRGPRAPHCRPTTRASGRARPCGGPGHRTPACPRPAPGPAGRAGPVPTRGRCSRDRRPAPEAAGRHCRLIGSPGHLVAEVNAVGRPRQLRE
jgi:hypothetical protein